MIDGKCLRLRQMPDMEVVHRNNVRNLGVILAGNHVIRCEMTRRKEVFFHFRQVEMYWGSLQKDSSGPERLIRMSATFPEKGGILLLMGMALAKIMKLIARETAGSA